MQNRRSFLKQSSLIALSPTVPGFLANYARANQPARDDRVLVVIQLDGGNDGVNTLVPFTDEGYAKHRKELFIKSDNLLKLNNQFGLNSRMRRAAKLWEDGQLAVIPAVGYPNPNRSHDVSMAIWQTCKFTTLEQNSYGWLGRSLDQTKPDSNGSPSSLLIGNRQPPIALQGRKSVASSIENLNDYILPNEIKTLMDVAQPTNTKNDLASFLHRTQTDAFNLSSKVEEIGVKIDNQARYPATRLADNLKTIAHLLKAGFGTNVFYTIQGGYDTHAGQRQTHGDLLATLSGAMSSFLDDLKASKLDDRVMVMCFSEFGRRVDENASAGTDHGTAGLVFLAGANANPGVHGKYPSLMDLDDGGLKVQTDFRSIYASILKDWLNVDPALVLESDFEVLSLINSNKS